MKLRAAELTPFSLRLTRSVVTGAQTISERRGVLLCLRDEEGLVGVGEATSFTGFGTESAEISHSALRSTLPAMIGRDAEDILPLLDEFRTTAPHAPCALSALDTALCDLGARRAGLPLASWLAAMEDRPARQDLPVNKLLVEQSPAALIQEVNDALTAGYQALKLKVGAADLARDCARVSAVRITAGPEIRIRLDANGAWGHAEALQALSALSAYDIEFIEQPVSAKDIEGLAKLRARGLISIAADESSNDAAGVREVIEREACDFIVLKPAAIGGPHAALDAARLAHAAGVGIVVTTLLDGAVGRAMALHVAAVVAPGEPSLTRQYAHGLATGGLLSEDFANGPEAKSGTISVPQRPGLGVSVSPARLREVATGPTEGMKLE